MSNTTKNALAESLKRLIEKKKLDKITVSDITEDCEVNRQTFYYHFGDIYDLVDWIYTRDAAKAIGTDKTSVTWQSGFMHIFEYVLENKAFVSNTYHSVSREHLERYLYNQTYTLLIAVVEELAAGIPMRVEDKEFIANFYKYAFVGITIDWIQTGLKLKPATIVERLDILVHGSILSAIERFISFDKTNYMSKI